MKYELLKNTISLLEDFEQSNGSKQYSDDLSGFKKWIAEHYKASNDITPPDWEGKSQGRSADSVISTLLVHMGRYGKSYSKSAIWGSEFATQEDFIYLINLNAFGGMSKMDLIKKNVQEKPVGMLIINRLLSKGWIKQEESAIDKRSKIIEITIEGQNVLDLQMNKIRKATRIVSGNLSEAEKMELIRLLTKLNDFHKGIYDENREVEELLDVATGRLN